MCEAMPSDYKTLSTSDRDNYPPGDYSIAIEGWIDANPSSIVIRFIEVTISDSCASATIDCDDGSCTDNLLLDYEYGGTLTFPDVFVSTNPTGCSITHSLCYTASSNTLCNELTADKKSLSTNDKVTHPPGVYTFRLTGRIDANESSTT